MFVYVYVCVCVCMCVYVCVCVYVRYLGKSQRGWSAPRNTTDGNEKSGKHFAK